MMLLGLILVSSGGAMAQTRYSSVPSTIEGRMAQVGRDADPTRLARFVAAAQAMLGLPFDNDATDSYPERLVVNVDALGYVSYVEYALAYALTLEEHEPSAAKYHAQVQQMRYRGGVVDGYGSRVLYPTEWAQQLIDRGILREVRLGGNRSHTRPIDYVSSHVDHFPMLQRDPSQLSVIKASEERLCSTSLGYLPTEKVERSLSAIRTGDIILFSSLDEGVDYHFVGVALIEGEKLMFMHASVAMKNAVIQREGLLMFLQRQSTIDGITVLRLQ